jgi:hypothetical protein
MTPLVSVVITSYNRPGLLRDAISSVLAQSFDDWELIVADDHSTEDTRSVVSEFSDPRIIFFQTPRRLGVAGNIRTALARTSGQYFSVLNDDDLWEPSLMHTLAARLTQSPETTVAFADHWIINLAGSVDIDASRLCSRRWKRDQLGPGLHLPFHKLALLDQSIPACASMFRSATIQGEEIPDAVGGLWDLWLTYLACRTGMGAHYVDQRLASFRIHPQSLTALRGLESARSASYTYTRLASEPGLVAIAPALEQRRQKADEALCLELLLAGERWQSFSKSLRGLRLRRSTRSLAVAALALTPGSVKALRHRRAQAL